MQSSSCSTDHPAVMQQAYASFNSSAIVGPRNCHFQRIRTLMLCATICTAILTQFFFRIPAKSCVPVYVPSRQQANDSDIQVLDISSGVHVAMGSGVEHWPGMKAAVVSMVNNTKTPERLHVHLFILDSNRSGAVRLAGAHLHFHFFSEADIQPYTNPHFSRTSVGDLKSPYNFVRFLLHERLRDVSSCLWLDSDMIVARDVVDFVTNAISKKALAAFPRSISPQTNDAHNKLRRAGIDVANPSPSFNAGVLLLNLDIWRSENVDSTIRRVCLLNEEMNLWPLFGSQPPLLMVLGGDRFQRLNVSLFVDTLGYAHVSDARIKEGTFLHWNGPKKPWQPDGMHKKWWVPYDDASHDRNIQQIQRRLSEVFST